MPGGSGGSGNDVGSRQRRRCDRRRRQAAKDAQGAALQDGRSPRSRAQRTHATYWTHAMHAARAAAPLTEDDHDAWRKEAEPGEQRAHDEHVSGLHGNDGAQVGGKVEQRSRERLTETHTAASSTRSARDQARIGWERGGQRRATDEAGRGCTAAAAGRAALKGRLTGKAVPRTLLRMCCAHHPPAPHPGLRKTAPPSPSRWARRQHTASAAPPACMAGCVGAR